MNEISQIIIYWYVVELPQSREVELSKDPGLARNLFYCMRYSYKGIKVRDLAHTQKGVADRLCTVSIEGFVQYS